MEDEPAGNAILEREDRIMRHAVSSVQRIEPYYDRPVVKDGETWIGWVWSLTRKPLPKDIGEVKLRADIYGTLTVLRQRVWTLPELSDARAAVLVHAALVMGETRILNNAALWAALTRQDYDTAEHVMLQTGWPALVGDDPQARQRVLQLARQLRTGVEA